MLIAFVFMVVAILFIYGAIHILTGWIFGPAAAERLSVVFNTLGRVAGKLLVVLIGLFFIVVIVIAATGWQPTP